MRIVGGRWAGRQLVSPGKRTRATAGPVRDAWITSLAPALSGARVLELFAGSGAVGLEALSRGAASVDFVEFGAPSLHALKANVAALHARDRTRIFKKDAVPFVQALEADAYDVALADPPYGSGALNHVIRRWIEVPFARILSVEHHESHELPAGGRSRWYDEGTVVTTYETRRQLRVGEEA